ncbi:Uncharacterised protein [uncultured archaeon]|nr:Uncharacterised protein [uncultured archaeon]
MAKKKRARKTRGTNSRASSFQNKIPLVVRKLILFTGLAVISFILFSLVKNDFLMRFFNVSAMVFGFVAVAFLIVLLVLWIMKFVKK